MKQSGKKQTFFKKIRKHPITIILVSTMAIILSTVLIKELITKPVLNIFFSSDLIIKTITAIIGSAVMIITYYLLLKYYEEKSFSEFALKQGFKESFFGFILGFGTIGLVVFLLSVMGYYKIIVVKSIIPFLPTLTFIFGAAILEEIIFRGLCFRLIEKWKGSIIALIVSAMIFQLPHFMNSHTGILPGILGVLFGLVLALIYADTKRLWVPIAFHFGWNLAQPVLGTTLSGVSEFTSLTDAQLNGPELFIGSGFGVEVSLFSFVLLFTIGIYYLKRLIEKGYFENRTSTSEAS